MQTVSRSSGTCGLIREGIHHKGFSLIDILQPCVSFNPVNTFSWYKERVYDLSEENYMPDNFEKALALARQKDDRIPTGILYRKEKHSFTDLLPALKKGPLVDRAYDPVKLQSILDR